MLANKQKAYVLCGLYGWGSAGEVVMCLLWDTQRDMGRGGGSLERGHWGSSSLLQTEGSLSDTRLGFYPWSSLKVMGSMLYHPSKHINTPLNSSLPHQRPQQEIVHIVGLGNILYIHTIFYILFGCQYNISQHLHNKWDRMDQTKKVLYINLYSYNFSIIF